ncbi:hypothetical protein [Bacillus tuaregi]|uniref:hypothetical protein n=1 Tax=Bacillus tuaregi TaxID=1816695 RepID=UPI0008F8F0A9|nr:hypothetical protein [Bacillus tuaregi]
MNHTILARYLGEIDPIDRIPAISQALKMNWGLKAWRMAPSGQEAEPQVPPPLYLSKIVIILM